MVKAIGGAMRLARIHSVIAPPPARRPARQRVGRRHADQQRQRGRDDAHDQAVDEGVAELRGPQRGIVGERRVEEQPRREAEDLGVGLERHQQQPQERRQRQQRQHDDQRVACRSRSRRWALVDTDAPSDDAHDHPAQHDGRGEQRDGDRARESEIGEVEGLQVGVVVGHLGDVAGPAVGQDEDQREGLDRIDQAEQAGDQQHAAG